jgi:hypothetical protein
MDVGVKNGFYEHKDKDLSNPQLQGLALTAYSGKLTLVREILDHMIKAVERDGRLQYLEADVSDQVIRFTSLLNTYINAQASSLKPDGINSIKAQIEEYLRRVYDGQEPHHQDAKLLRLYTIINGLLGENATTYASIQEQISGQSKRIDSLVAIQKSKETTNAFREFFSTQAKIHSGRPSLKPFFIPGAYLWMALGIFSLIPLFCQVYDLRTSVTSSIRTQDSLRAVAAANDTSRSVTSSKLGALEETWYSPLRWREILLSIFVISLFIFITRFCFRQFSIHKHLYTVNAHKANVAGTLHNLIDSTLGQDTATRAQIASETVKTLVHFDGSGYMDSNNPEVMSPLEIITKQVMPKA